MAGYSLSINYKQKLNKQGTDLSSLLLSITDGAVVYSGKPVFEGLSFNIHENRKIALVGRNGAGKTTLMRVITGDKDLDDGERWVENGISIGYLKQDITPKEGQSVFDFIMEEIDAEFKAAHEYKVDIVTDKLALDPKALMTNLSGGQLRRAGLARALVDFVNGRADQPFGSGSYRMAGKLFKELSGNSFVYFARPNLFIKYHRYGFLAGSGRGQSLPARFCPFRRMVRNAVGARGPRAEKP